VMTQKGSPSVAHVWSLRNKEACLCASGDVNVPLTVALRGCIQ